MTVLQTIAVAFAMFSAVPVPQFDWNEKNMRYSLCAFPLVGVLCGVLWCVCASLPLPAMVRAAGFCLIPVWVTGGIHLDGYADTCDALCSYGDTQKKLDILKDPHCGAFAVQAGNLKNGVFEDVTFEHCFADGLHLNGNTDTVWIRDVRGYVGDDLVALNMYDWQDSSVNFGPTRTVWCENLTLSPESPYKALRIEPGVYYYDDGTSVDCSLHDAVFKNVRGVNTFKLYYQTPAYLVSESPERGGVGSGGDLYFEDIEIDLAAPIDRLPDYVNSDPVTGSFAAFELGSNLESVTLRNVRVRLHRDRYPMSFLVCAGPKSCRVGEKEIFDPYLSSETKRLVLEDITIDGEHPEDVAPYVREIAFDDPARFACPPAAGRIREIEYRK